MPSNPHKPSEMTCADFEAVFDAYVDDTLEAAIAEAAHNHVSMCRCCDREVTRWQQTRILLSTAVADFASAVDVSAMRSDVFAALGLDAKVAEERRRGALREAAHERGLGAGRRPGRSAGRKAATARRSGLSAAWRFASAATVSAVTAAAAVLLLSPAPQMAGTAGQTVASAKPAASFATNPVKFIQGLRNGGLGDIAPVAYTPPPLARPEVSRVEGIETGPGHQVSTWVQPRTNARVIWVENRGLGTPVRTAAYEPR